MDSRRIVFLIGRLDAAFSHARVGVAETQLRRQQDGRAVLARFNSRRGPGAPASDDEDVRIVLDMAQVKVRAEKAALSLQTRRQLAGHLIACIGADHQNRKILMAVIGMIIPQQLLLFLSRIPAQLRIQALVPRSVYAGLRRQHFFCIFHGAAYLSMSRASYSR